MIEKKTSKQMQSRRALSALLPFLLLAVALLFGSKVLSAQAEVHTPNQTCIVDAAGGGTHLTIQNAISDPACHDVEIVAGYYTENITFTHSITVTGAGIGSTIVDATGGGSVFKCGDENVGGPTIKATISDMTIQGGNAQEGGGIFNGFNCYLTGNNLDLIGNLASGEGGAINNMGIMTITHARIAGSIAAVGGGVRSGGNMNTFLTMSDTEILGNYATGPGGGMFISSEANLTRVDVISNGSDDNAGGIFAGSMNSDLVVPIKISESRIQDNIAGGPGGIMVYNHVTIDSTEILSNTGARTQMPGVTIRGGGIAIFNKGVLTLTNSTVSNNVLDPLLGTVFTYGGGIHVGGDDCRLWMVNTTVSNNEPGGVVDSTDAILFNSSAVVDIRNSDISDNIGSGIYGKGNLTVINSYIADNNGAGIAYHCTTNCGTGSTLLMKHSIVRQNGGFGVSGDNLTIRHSLIRNNGGFGVSAENLYMVFSTVTGHSNTAAGGGVTGNNLEIRSSTINNNHSDVDGGGIYVDNTLTVVNSTISGNTTNGNGGGIALFSSGATASLDSVTVAYNTADLDADNVGDGGGIFKDSVANSFSVNNSIIGNNQDDSPIALAREHDCFGNFSAGWSLAEVISAGCTGFSAATNINGQDPQLSPLADNGGPTWTHEIAAGSPAVYYTVGANCQDYDQRGVERDTINFCDIGAYERGTCPAPIQPTLAITYTDAHIKLTWDEHEENREVEIWRGTDPFAAGTFSNTWINLSANTSYFDYDAIGNPATNHYYAVLGQNACGATSAPSNVVGEFDFRLDEHEAASIASSAGLLRYLHFALISIPLEGPNLPTTADDVAEYIDPEGGIRAVAKWNSQTNSWIVRRIASPFGTLNFAISPGDVLLIAMTDEAPESFAWVGDVPAPGTIQNNLPQGGGSFVIVPLDQSGQFTMTADGLAAEIGDISHVGTWSTALQRWFIRVVNTIGVNFPIRPGYPYGVSTGPSTPSVWP